MSTATFAREAGIAPVSQAPQALQAQQGPQALQARQKDRHPLSLSASAAPGSATDLTIHRITGTHHGRTLLMLGHAAEYLVSSRRFVSISTTNPADEDAVHILMEMSRLVFEEYAETVSGRRTFEEKVLGLVTKLLN